MFLGKNKIMSLHHIHKHRLNKEGVEIGFKEKHEVGGTIKTTERIKYQSSCK